MGKYFNIPLGYHVLYLPQECAIPSLALNLSKVVSNNAIYIVNDKMSDFAYKEAVKVNHQAISLDNLSKRHEYALNFG